MAACQEETGGDGYLLSRIQLSRQFVSLTQPLMEGLTNLRTRWGGEGSLDTQTTRIEELVGINDDSEKVLPTFTQELQQLSKAARSFKQANVVLRTSIGGMPIYDNQRNIFYVIYLLNKDYPVPPEGVIPENYPTLVAELAALARILGGKEGERNPRQSAQVIWETMGKPSPANIWDDLQQVIPVLFRGADTVWGALTAVEDALGERGEEGDIESEIHKQRKRINQNEPTFSGAVDSVKGDLGTPLETLKEGTEFLLRLAGTDPEEPVARSLNWRMQRGIELTQKGVPGWLDGTLALHTLVGGDLDKDLYAKLSELLSNLNAFLLRTGRISKQSWFTSSNSASLMEAVALLKTEPKHN